MSEVSKQYPIGKFVVPTTFVEENIQGWIKEIASLPERLQKVLVNMTEQEYDTPYRENGWTVKQVVHHLADSHMNAFIRCKLALTEENPTIKPYFEGEWANLADVEGDVTSSMQILTGLHHRWTRLLQSMSKEDFKKTFYHPEMKVSISLYTLLALYVWHGNHHLGHIKLVESSEGN
ncbi:MAG: YfiT family bacillithiol transferase [Bacillaceae bacterium]